MQLRMKKGFSLIEIGIVMVVIGLIIAAVMKGKDVIKSAEVKEISQNFLSKWVSSSGTYYDKLGYNFNGSSAYPQVYGSDAALGSAIAKEVLPQVCVDTSTKDQFKTDAGINLDKLIRTDSSDVCFTNISGEFTDDKKVEQHYAYMKIAGDEGSLYRNIIVFNNVPIDVAKAFDKLVDSAVDGTKGKVITNTTPATGASVLPATGEITPTAWGDVGSNLVTNVIVILEH